MDELPVAGCVAPQGARYPSTVRNGQDSGAPGVDGEGRPTVWERMSGLFLKPVDRSAPHAPVAPPPTVEELQEASRAANDKERAIGLLVAPIGALIAFLVIHADITNDPAQYLKNGSVNPKYTPVATYHELLVVLLVLAVAMLAAAWFRKRLFMGVVAALYGLAVFNLHWWGFGVPFVLVGAWYLVRAYRIQRDLKAAGVGPGRAAGRPSPGGTAQPRASKRYTPPSPRSRRAGASKAAPGDQRAG